MTQINITIPTKFQFLLKEKSRYKVAYGGRGGGKSESFARALLILALNPKILFPEKEAITILCVREYQSSIAHSVHKAFADIINLYNLNSYFTITNAEIRSVNGSKLQFKGISNDPLQIKSTFGVDLCWVEEGEKASAESWNFLTPTIRNADSEIWVSFNPNDRTDPTYKMFVENTRPDTIAVKINYYDNPYFSKSPIYQEMLYDKEHNIELYNNKWLGEVKQLSDALIFKDKYQVREFGEPDIAKIVDNRFFYGIDFGFSSDAFAVIRCFIIDNELFIDYEAGGVGISIVDLKNYIAKIPEAKKWIIYGDSARPETINHLRAVDGYNVKPCDKGKGSVEDGIEHLRSYKKITIHPRCRELINEFGLYCYKVDKTTGEILPIIVDKYNHYIDALRYSLTQRIKRRIAFGIINY